MTAFLSGREGHGGARLRTLPGARRHRQGDHPLGVPLAGRRRSHAPQPIGVHQEVFDNYARHTASFVLNVFPGEREVRSLDGTQVHLSPLDLCPLLEAGVHVTIEPSKMALLLQALDSPSAFERFQQALHAAVVRRAGTCMRERRPFSVVDLLDAIGSASDSPFSRGSLKAAFRRVGGTDPQRQSTQAGGAPTVMERVGHRRLAPAVTRTPPEVGGNPRWRTPTAPTHTTSSAFLTSSPLLRSKRLQLPLSRATPCSALPQRPPTEDPYQNYGRPEYSNHACASGHAVRRERAARGKARWRREATPEYPFPATAPSLSGPELPLTMRGRGKGGRECRHVSGRALSHAQRCAGALPLLLRLRR